MKRALIALCVLALLTSGCSHKSKQPAPLQATATGAAIVESSGGKQIGYIGMPLDQPVVVQVNDASGSGSRRSGRLFQRTIRRELYSRRSADRLQRAGHEHRLARPASRAIQDHRPARGMHPGKTRTPDRRNRAWATSKPLGAQLNAQYCIRCHDPESTPLRVSNMDNLSVKPHPFTEGDTLNKMSDADLIAIISHGGPALNKSAEMPPWGYTLSKSDIAALVSYIRAVADPPYEAGGLVYAQK